MIGKRSPFGGVLKLQHLRSILGNCVDWFTSRGTYFFAYAGRQFAQQYLVSRLKGVGDSHRNYLWLSVENHRNLGWDNKLSLCSSDNAHTLPRKLQCMIRVFDFPRKIITNSVCSTGWTEYTGMSLPYLYDGGWQHDRNVAIVKCHIQTYLDILFLMKEI